MPQQFIQVKESAQAVPNPDLGGSERNQDWDSTSNVSNSDICRICHCEGDSENPLLSPCYCLGSLKYVHEACLRRWLTASDTRSCELCKFNYILQMKVKPITQWRRPDLGSVENRKILCSILFNVVASVCVIWSIFVLIERAAEEVRKGLIAWPFWTKLVVVSVGATGGVVFMYIQCRQYLDVFSRWKAQNKIILVQNAPEKTICTPPSPGFFSEQPPKQNMLTKIVTVAEYNQPSSLTNCSSQDLQRCCYVFENECKVKSCSSSTSSILKAEVHVEKLSNTPHIDVKVMNDSSKSNLQALDIECPANRKKYSLQNSLKTDIVRSNSCVFKSLPNLNTSCENLLL